MNKERVILNGFLIDVEVPSEERMAIRIDITHTPTHLTWISEVQDLLATIDQEYREKYSKRKAVEDVASELDTQKQLKEPK